MKKEEWYYEEKKTNIYIVIAYLFIMVIDFV